MDRKLSIEVAGGEIVAVLRFDGSATREVTERALSTLRAALERGENSWTLLRKRLNMSTVRNTKGLSPGSLH